MLEIARAEIEKFAAAMFRHAGADGFVSLRAFYEDEEKPFRISSVAMTGGIPFLVESAVDDANRAANHPRKIVFCPPVATFRQKESARERDLLAGLALSVECDQRPTEAAARLEQILGPATLIVRSGGIWTDSATNQIYDKLHLHWRLRAAAHGSDLVKLKQARDLAARLVGGDPSNKPVCHPIRWPGSWHRKAEPRLCEIETQTDHEIDLGEALTALQRAAPSGTTARRPARDPFEDPGQRDGQGSPGWADLVTGVVTAADYHNAIARLAAKMVSSGMDGGTAVNMLRGMMDSSTGPRDERWQSRFDDIPRAVSTAQEKYKAQDSSAGSARPGRIVLGLAEFLAEYEPPDYLIDGLLQQHYFYSLTGMTGSGKTAVMLLIAVKVATKTAGQKLGPYDIEPGRVVYVTKENPTDVRMRLIGMATKLGIRPDSLDFFVIRQIDDISKDLPRITKEIEALGPVALVIVDTSPSLFTGEDENSNKLMGDHARNIRKLCDLPGRPCTVALCHPTKRPSGKDDLLPRGGGAYIAEVDGNLCLWGHDDKLADLHWTGKFRGPDFEPICFRLETVTTTNLVDRKGKLLPTVMAHLVTEAEAVAEVEHARNDENQLLAALLLPGQSIAQLATACGWITTKGEPHKSKVDRTMKRLAADKLVAKKRGDWTLTETGKTAAGIAASRRSNHNQNAPKHPS